VFSAIFRKPTFWSPTYTKIVETITVIRNGNHQLALLRRSVKALRGAKKVFRTRAGSDSEAVSAIGAGTGDTGVAAISNLREASGTDCSRLNG